MPIVSPLGSGMNIPGVESLDNITQYVIFATMTGESIRTNRREAGWTQERLAARLGVSQEYVSLMERGRRAVPAHVARAVTRLLKLPATALPLPESDTVTAAGEPWVEHALTRLGYPGFAYRGKPGPKRNPAEVLLRALARDELDPRLIEALPWLLLQFEGFDCKALAIQAKVKDLQNRLGFTVSMAREVAEQDPRWRHRTQELHDLTVSIEPSRLAREDTYCVRVRSERMRDWLRSCRSKSAEHWNLLTDLRKEHLPYVGDDSGPMVQLSS
jgi:transcriptional regulator with XRE-family HTH domain